MRKFATILLCLIFLSVCIESYSKSALPTALKNLTTESGYSYFKDSDDAKAIHYFQKFILDLSKQWDAGYTYQRVFFDEPGSPDVNENRHDFWAAFNKDAFYLKAAYGFRDFFNVDNSHTYRLDGSFPLGVVDSVTLFHGLKHVDTALAITNKVKYYFNGISVYQELPEQFYLNLYYQRDLYNDNNRRDNGNVGISKKLLEDIDVRLGYEFVYYNAQKSNPNYWTPNNLRIHQARLSVRESFFKERLKCYLSYVLGRAKEAGDNDQLSQAAQASAEWEIKDSLTFFISYNFSNTPSYDSQTAQGGFRFKF